MEKVRSQDGTSIAFDRLGKGRPIILVGGALSQRSSPRVAQFAALLAPHLTVYSYDRRGRGDSGDTAPYAVEREVEDIHALIQEAGGSAFVFGSSSGAALALEAAAHGLAIDKLALWEPPFIVDDSRPQLPEDHLARITELISSGRRGAAVELFMIEAVGVPAEAVAPMRGAPTWPALEAVAHTLAYDLIIMGDSSLPAERAAAVTMPTLVMDGGASPAWIRAAARALTDVLPNAQRRTLEGQDHAADPAAVAAVLVTFFSG